jgi:hypothetical protein
MLTLFDGLCCVGFINSVWGVSNMTEEDRPDLSSERAPHRDNTATFRQNITSGHGLQIELDTTTYWLTDGLSNMTLTLTLAGVQRYWNRPSMLLLKTETESSVRHVVLLNKRTMNTGQNYEKKETPWSESASEVYRPSDRRLLAKWLPTFVDIGCHVVSVTDLCGRILGFLYRSRYSSIK